ncbi:MAG: hypothetical protein JKY12_07045 [Sneathiella sp.]|nr:hypothetical protein [Sneathiella sp.]
MTPSHNFKNFHSVVDQLVVNLTSVSSRFNLQSTRARARMLRPIVELQILSALEKETVENTSSTVDPLLQAASCIEEQPIACPVPNLSKFDEEKTQISKNEGWFSKLFNLKPKP